MREPPPTACPRMEESHWTNPFAVLWWFRRILVSLLETNSRFRNEVGTPAHCWWSKNLWYWLWSVDDFHRTEVSGTSTASGHEIAAFSDGVDFFINPSIPGQNAKLPSWFTDQFWAQKWAAYHFSRCCSSWDPNSGQPWTRHDAIDGAWWAYPFRPQKMLSNQDCQIVNL